MSVTMFGRARGVWSEADYMALPETSAAGIPHYLLIDRYPTMVLRLFRLKDEHYVEEATAIGDQSLRLPAPLDVLIDAATLLHE